MNWSRVEQRIDDIDAENLKLQVKGAARSFVTHISHHYLRCMIIYSTRRIFDIYLNLNIALRLIVTLPVTVTSGERSFSSFKLIKTYLRPTTITQNNKE